MGTVLPITTPPLCDIHKLFIKPLIGLFYFLGVALLNQLTLSRGAPLYPAGGTGGRGDTPHPSIRMILVCACGCELFSFCVWVCWSGSTPWRYAGSSLARQLCMTVGR